MGNPNINEGDQKKLRVLVAEDNEVNQKLIRRILQTAGYAVDIVDNGREAVEFASWYHYDFILMDLQMPVMDGYEATKRIRKLECGMRNCNSENSDSNFAFRTPNSEFKEVPIVAITGSSVEDEKKKCLALGMNDCIGKPLFRDQLLSLIKKWTGTEPIGPGTGQAPKVVSKPAATKSVSRQPIDLDRALIEFMGEKEVLHDILNEFTGNVRYQIKSIQQALHCLDFKAIAKEAHSIKGGAANLTANKVAGIASALEKAANFNKIELARSLAGELEEKFQQLEIFLQKENISVYGV